MKITTRKNKQGYTNFFADGKNVTGLWMHFFSGLSMKQEKKCIELFTKYYE